MFNKVKKGLMALAFCFVLPMSSYAQDNSPTDIVHLFNQCYGTARMDEVAPYTTAQFRNNKPKSVWISDTWKILRQIAYKREQSAVIGSKIAKKRAAVAIEAKIETSAGKTHQKEIFYLIKNGKDWFIDELKIADEKIEASLKDLKL